MCGLLVPPALGKWNFPHFADVHGLHLVLQVCDFHYSLLANDNLGHKGKSNVLTVNFLT